MTMKLGMCGFTIGAESYFRQFGVVEVQQTFYDPPPLATVRRWRAQAPRSFEFTLKAWQVITHRSSSSTYRRLRRPFSDAQRTEAGEFRLNDTTLSAWQTTLEACTALRATAVLFQCPASFRPTTENIDAMRTFLSAVKRPAGVRLLWEPRGPWPDDVVLSLCRELDLVHAVDPFIRPSLTPSLLYWRLHGNGSHYANYADDDLRQLIHWLPVSGGGDAYVLFNNVPRTKDVKRFRELLAEVRPDLARTRTGR
jgi:uncharacterized protein YecE (DUF72 family)